MTQTRTKEQILLDIDEAKQIPTTEWINRLEKVSNGANIHHVNKAIFYLRRFSDEQYRYSKDGIDRLQMLTDQVLQSLRDNDFARLGRYMKGWW